MSVPKRKAIHLIKQDSVQRVLLGSRATRGSGQISGLGVYSLSSPSFWYLQSDALALLPTPFSQPYGRDKRGQAVPRDICFWGK